MSRELNGNEFVLAAGYLFDLFCLLMFGERRNRQGRRGKEEEGGGRRRKEEEGGGRRRKEEEGGGRRKEEVDFGV
jgi:hypothetical protein